MWNQQCLSVSDTNACVWWYPLVSPTGSRCIRYAYGRYAALALTSITHSDCLVKSLSTENSSTLSDALRHALTAFHGFARLHWRMKQKPPLQRVLTQLRWGTHIELTEVQNAPEYRNPSRLDRAYPDSRWRLRFGWEGRTWEGYHYYKVKPSIILRFCERSHSHSATIAQKGRCHEQQLPTTASTTTLTACGRDGH